MKCQKKDCPVWETCKSKLTLIMPANPGQFSGYVCKLTDTEYYTLDNELFLTWEQVNKLKEGGW